MFEFLLKKNKLLKNSKLINFNFDYYINPINGLIFMMFSISAILSFFYFGDMTSLASNKYAIYIVFLFPFLSLTALVFGKWLGVVKMIFLAFIIYFLLGCKTNALLYVIIMTVGNIISPIIQIAREWDRGVILRFGKFNKLKGPGVFVLLPFADTINKIIDLRIRVTDFAAETTLTKDSVTITVDAIAFWLVWDPEKAVCEVENYMEAVVLASQTALRNAISMNSLSTLLEKGENIEEAVRKEVDKKTTEWGITIQHIEITEIEIPKKLQKSISRLAHAEREKKARIKLGEAEIEIAEKFEEASKIYKKNDVALQLRNMNIVLEGVKAGNSMMVLPSNVMDSMDLGTVMGAKAIMENRKLKSKN